MATVISTMSVKMDLDATGFNTAMDNVRKKLDDTGARLRGLGTQLTGAVTAPIAGAFGAAVMAASDLNETLNKTGVVFGDAADGVVAWSQDSATAFGLSQDAALGAAATFGNIFTGMGMTGEAAAAMSQDIVGLGADLGSFNNVPTAEALDAIRAGLLGEYEPLRRFGIVLDAAAVEAKALEMGLVDANGEVTQAGLVAARQALITEGAANAQGDFAETSGSLANQLKILRARLTNAAAAIGQILLPYVTRLVGFISSLVERFGNLSNRMKVIIVVFGAIAASIGPVLLALGIMLPIISKVIGVGGKLIKLFKALRIAMMGSLWPILLIVAALAAIYFIWTRDLFGIRTKITKWFDVFKAPGGGLDKIKAGFDRVKTAVMDFAGKALKKASELFTRFIDAMRGPAISAFNAFKSVLSTVVGFVGMVIGGIISRLDPLKSAFYGVVAMVQGFVDLVKALFEGDLRGALDAAIDIFKGWLQYLTGLGGFLLSVMTGVLGYLWDAIAAVDWVGLGLTLLEYLQSAIVAMGSLTLEMAGKAGELIGGLVNFIETYNWVQLGLDILTWIGTAVTSIGSLGETLSPKGGELLGGLKDGAIGAWTAFTEWFSLRKDRILDIAKLMFLPYTLYKYGDDIISGIWTGAKAAWGLIDDWFLGLVDLLVANAKFLFLPWVLYKYGDDVIRGIWLGMKWTWGKIDEWFLGLVDLLVENAKFLFLPWVLYKYGDDIIRGIWSGMKWVWGKIEGWFDTLMDLLIDIAKIIFLPTAIYYYGEDVMNGLWNGMKYIWGVIGGWLAGLGRAIITLLKFIFLPTLIYFYGKDILNGFLDGMKAIWDGVTGVAKWLGGLGGKVLSAIGDVTKLLWNTGWNIMWGLWDGLKSVWEDIKKWFTNITDEIPEWKGPLTVDRVLLEPGGEAIMDGLLRGMRSQEPAIRAYLSGLTSTIGDTAFGVPTLASVGAVGGGGGIAAGAIVINVSGAGDPDAVAESVYGRFSRELGLRGAI